MEFDKTDFREGGSNIAGSINEGGLKSGRLKINPGAGQILEGQKLIPLTQSGTDSSSMPGGSKSAGSVSDPIKNTFKDSKKYTLSPRAIVSGFYKGIGQQRISKEKRERAEDNFKELLDDGFKSQDIQFAVEWTLKNAREELYDFSIIKHTIGQAMASRRKIEAEEAKRREREKAAAQKEAEEKKAAEEEKRIKAYKESLDAEERARLRERAEAEIRNSGQYRKEFITDYLIEAMENNLVRDQIDMKPSE